MLGARGCREDKGGALSRKGWGASGGGTGCMVGVERERVRE